MMMMMMMTDKQTNKETEDHLRVNPAPTLRAAGT